MKLLANEDCTVEITSSGVSGVVSINSSPSTVLFANNKSVYAGPMILSITNIKKSSCGTATPGTATAIIQPTSKKITTQGKAVLREGDKVTGVKALGATEPNSPSPTPCSIMFDVEITNSGQSVVKGK